MNKTKWAVVILVVALVSMSCQLFAPSSQKEPLADVSAKRAFTEQAVFDLKAPLPSPGAASLRVLAGWDPAAAALAGEVEAAERGALDAFIKGLTAQFSMRNEPALPTAQIASLQHANRASVSGIQVSYHDAPVFQDGSTDTTHDVSLLSGLVTGLGDLISDHMPAGVTVRPSENTKEGDSTTTMTADIGKSTDGGSKFGMGMQTETVKDGVTTKTDFNASVDGRRCPNEEGQVSFTVKVRLGAGKGNNSFARDLTAFVRAVVDDNAQIATTTIDIEQATTQVKSGTQVYIETGATVKYSKDNLETSKISNVRLIQSTDNAIWNSMYDLSSKGLEAALSMGRTALLVAQDRWRSGACVKIDAKSPGKVKPGSTTPIAVTVLSKFDGSTVPSKLEAVLSGEKSLDPTFLPKTPGTLNYTAPGESGKIATIKLTATSRRGIATLDVTANTGGQSFTLNADGDGAHFSGTICNPSEPFDIKVAASGESWLEHGTPSSGMSGQLAGGLTTDGCSFDYHGPYTIVINEDGSATLQWTDSWTVDCPGLGHESGVSNYQFALQPAPDTSCQ